MNHLATAKVEDVFRAMSQPSEPVGGGNYIILGVIAVIGVLMIASFFTRSGPQKKKVARSRPTKLIKHLARQLGLKSREMKQLKQLAEQEKLENPLVLLLCPSVLQSAAKKRKELRAA